jgi:PAS domain S-box-containing protein
VSGRRSVVGSLVLVTTVVGLLTAVVGLAVVRQLERDTVLGSASAAQLATAERTAGVVDARVEMLQAKLRLLATREQLADLDAEASGELQVALRVTDLLEELELIDLDGQPRAGAAIDRVFVPEDAPVHDEVAALLEGERSRTVAGADRPPMLELSVPLESPPGTPVGVLLARAALDLVADEVVQPLPTGGRAALVDASGRPLVDRDSSRVAAGDRLALGADLAGPQTRTVDGPDGATVLAAAPLRTLEGAIVIEQRESDLVEGATTGLRGPAGVLLLVVLATVVAVIATGERLLRPLGPLADAVRRLGAGERGVRVEARGTGEVADLAAGFNTMAAALESRRRDLEEAERTARMSEERLRLVVEGVQDYAIVLLDVLGDVRTWNAGAERVTGVAAEAVLGRRLTDLADPDEPTIDPLAQATRSGRGEAEGWYRRPDGSRYWGQLTVTTLRREDGTPYGYAAILQDVTERRAGRLALEEALHREQEAAVELRRANDLKDEFLAVAAHEIRTPLSAILGASRLLGGGPEPLSPAETEEIVGLIWTHANDMHDIVERLLEFTQLQAGRVHLAPRPLELRAEIQAVAASVDRLLAAHEVEVVAPAATEVVLDAGLLRQVLTNLLSNAAKFSDPGTTVSVRAEVAEGWLTVAVTDRGIGIAPEDHERVFELFRQADQHVPSSRGTGVGLAIVHRYVGLAGGRIEVDSERGRGATFTVHLPLVTVPEPTPPGRDR